MGLARLTIQFAAPYLDAAVDSAVGSLDGQRQRGTFHR
jgi:hypothetical protein